MRKITYTILCRPLDNHCIIGILSSQCCPNTPPWDNISQKIMWAMLAQGTNSYTFAGKPVAVLVACFLTGYNITNNLDCFCSMLAAHKSKSSFTSCRTYIGWDIGTGGQHWLQSLKKESIFVPFILPRRKCSYYSVLNTLSEHTFTYQKILFHTLLLLYVFKIFKSLFSVSFSFHYDL